MLVPWRIICNFHFEVSSNSSRPTIPGSCHSSVRSCLHCRQWRRECVTGFPRVLDGAGGWAWPLHPGRLTWTIIMEVWKIIFLSKWVICRFHVNLLGCMNHHNEVRRSGEPGVDGLEDDFPFPGLYSQVPAVNLLGCIITMKCGREMDLKV